MCKFFKKVRNFGWRYAVVNTGYHLGYRLTHKRRFQRGLMRLNITYLEKRYAALMQTETPWQPIPEDYIVWTCWWQGLDQAPQIVKKCVASIQAAFPRHRVVVIDLQNYQQYVQFDPVIIEKFNRKLISYTNFSDLLRAALLSKFGGVWVDATVYLTQNMETIISQNPLFYSPKMRVVNNNLWMNNLAIPVMSKFFSYFMACGPACPMMNNLLNVQLAYWREHNLIVDYFLMDYILEMQYRLLPEVKQVVDALPINNPDVEFLVKHLAEPYDDALWQYYRTHQAVHKLTYKRHDFDKLPPDSFYGQLF